jgi:hypothetical protein
MLLGIAVLLTVVLQQYPLARFVGSAQALARPLKRRLSKNVKFVEVKEYFQLKAMLLMPFQEKGMLRSKPLHQDGRQQAQNATI